MRRTRADKASAPTATSCLGELETAVGDVRHEGSTFRAHIEVLESMGSDVFVYFTKDIEQGVNAAELEELARDSGRADAGASGDTVVARLDAATGIREGQDAELWVDTRAMHVFDPSSLYEDKEVKLSDLETDLSHNR